MRSSKRPSSSPAGLRTGLWRICVIMIRRFSLADLGSSWCPFCVLSVIEIPLRGPPPSGGAVHGVVRARIPTPAIIPLLPGRAFHPVLELLHAVDDPLQRPVLGAEVCLHLQALVEDRLRVLICDHRSLVGG